MGEKLIYLDHAATSYPKPPEVLRAVQQCMQKAGGNPGRGSHRLATRASEELYSCRETAGMLFDASPERVVCTSGATMGLNLALHGLLQPGDHVLIDNLAHNAVYRPVYTMAAKERITFDIYEADGSAPACLHSLAQLIRPETKMVVATHMSNICSITEPVPEIGQFCREHGLLFVVDGAQSGGHIPISVREMGITALSLPGHKGLLGPQGCGLLVFGEDAPECEPLFSGGSGSHSLDPFMPQDLPEHLEAGTLPTPAIAGLTAGLRLLQKDPPAERFAAASALGRLFAAESVHLPGLHLFGSSDGSVVSFGVDGHLPSRIAGYLNRYGICVRSGYHCAPVAHRTIGSFSTGTVRVSFGRTNTAKEVWRLLEVLDQFCRIEK